MDENERHREDCKDKWFYEYIDVYDDKQVEESTITHTCPKCNEAKLMKSFVIPAWWDGYQSWFNECWECRFKKNMEGLGKALVKMHQQHPDLEVMTSIVTPQETITFETKSK